MFPSVGSYTSPSPALVYVHKARYVTGPRGCINGPKSCDFSVISGVVSGTCVLGHSAGKSHIRHPKYKKHRHGTPSLSLCDEGA